MEKQILKHAPDYWNKADTDWETTYELSRTSPEFAKVEAEIRKALGANYDIKKISRFQSIFDLGQTLVREQLLLNVNPNEQYYRVRRFIKLGKQYLNAALSNNLDPRRCGLNTLQLQNRIENVFKGDILFVVQVVTSVPSSAEIIPDSRGEYFIDYFAEF